MFPRESCRIATEAIASMLDPRHSSWTTSRRVTRVSAARVEWHRVGLFVWLRSDAERLTAPLGAPGSHASGAAPWRAISAVLARLSPACGADRRAHSKSAPAAAATRMMPSARLRRALRTTGRRPSTHPRPGHTRSADLHPADRRLVDLDRHRDLDVIRHSASPSPSPSPSRRHCCPSTDPAGGSPRPCSTASGS
jgi:hypothetical protein